MPRDTVKSRADMVAKRYGNPKPPKAPKKGKTTIRPKGNPLKGVYGFKVKTTF
jgi:hypothetical protein